MVLSELYRRCAIDVAPLRLQKQRQHIAEKSAASNIQQCCIRVA